MDVKLRSLVQNESIRRLALGWSGSNPHSWVNLTAWINLRELSLNGVLIDGATIEWLAKTFPKLRKLECKRFGVRRLRLENVAELESLFAARSTNDPQDFYPADAMDALRLVEVPKLKEYFTTWRPMLSAHIENAPALRGLSFQYPLPAGP